MRHLSFILLGLAVLIFLGRVVAALTPATQGLADLPPLAVATATATPFPAISVVVAAATATELPPDTDQGWAVRKETGGQVSFGYVSANPPPPTYFTCTQLDRDLRFAGLSNYQQRSIREMCFQR